MAHVHRGQHGGFSTWISRSYYLINQTLLWGFEVVWYVILLRLCPMSSVHKSCLAPFSTGTLSYDRLDARSEPRMPRILSSNRSIYWAVRFSQKFRDDTYSVVESIWRHVSELILGYQRQLDMEAVSTHRSVFFLYYDMTRHGVNANYM
jgi:hypothetical protein